VVAELSVRIGVYGGMFDPVHNGHLRAGLEVLEAGGLDQLRLIPCHRPPHRKGAVGSPAQRLAWLQLGCAGEAGLIADDRELRRERPSWTVDTLRSLRDEFSDARLYLLLGEDSFQTLPDWHCWLDIGEIAHIVVMTRPGVERACPAALSEWLIGRAVEQWAALDARPVGGVLRQPVTQLAIASTDLRARLAAGRSVRYLVPDRVCDALQAAGAYGPSSRA
jgi:nicotinate-nucleotide adenylyltransferase